MKEEQANPAVGEALVELLRLVYEKPAHEGVSTAIHGNMLTLTQKIVDARADRLTTVTTHFQSLSWTALFLLGFLTQFALGMGFLDRPASNRAVLVLFSLAAVVALWLIAIQDIRSADLSVFRRPVSRMLRCSVPKRLADLRQRLFPGARLVAEAFDPCRQFAQDFVPLRVAHRAPARDFLQAPPAAPADIRAAVHGADADAGALDRL